MPPKQTTVSVRQRKRVHELPINSKLSNVPENATQKRLSPAECQSQSPDRRYILEAQPIVVAGTYLDRIAGHTQRLGVTQPVGLDVAVSESQVIALAVTDGGRAGERPAVVHGHQEPAVIYRRFIFLYEDPDFGGPGCRDFVIADESAIAAGVRVSLHLPASDPAIHGIAARARHAGYLRRIARATIKARVVRIGKEFALLDEGCIGGAI